MYLVVGVLGGCTWWAYFVGVLGWVYWRALVAKFGVLGG